MANKKKRLDFHKIHTYPIREHENKIKISQFVKDIPKKGIGFKQYIDGLPDISAGRNFNAVVDAVIDSRKHNKPIIFCMGREVFSCGLSPVIIRLMEEGLITAIALEGDGSISDFEIALVGQTGEDMSGGIEDGTFGTAEETGKFMNKAMAQGSKQGLGAGDAVGGQILKEDFPYKEYSILAKGIELDIPVTVHIAVGSDVIHYHPLADGEALGGASLIDFQIFAGQISGLEGGGIIINLCAAGILEKVLLNAITVSRNLGHKIKDFIIADLDTRASKFMFCNELSKLGIKCFSIAGDIGLSVPMLAQAVIDKRKN